MDAEVIVKLDKLVSLQMRLNDKNMFEGDLVQICKYKQKLVHSAKKN